MPRRSSSSRGGYRPRSPSPAPRQSVAATRPLPAQTAPQTRQSGGILSGIGSTIAQGMAFGAGSQVAHQAVRSMIGGSHGQQVQEQRIQNEPQQQQYQSNPCQTEMDQFSKCLSDNANISYCQTFSDMLKNCRQNNHLL